MKAQAFAPNKDADRLPQDNSNLVEEIKLITGKKAELENELANQSAVNSKLDTENENLKGMFTSLFKSFQDFKNTYVTSLKEVEAALESAKKEAAEKDKNVKESFEVINNMKTHINQLEVSLSKAQNNAIEKEKMDKEAIDQIALLKKQIEDLQGEISAAKSEMSNAFEKDAKANKVIEELKIQIAELGEALAKAQAEAEQKHKLLMEHEGSSNNLKDQLQKLQDELNKARINAINKENLDKHTAEIFGAIRKEILAITQVSSQKETAFLDRIKALEIELSDAKAKVIKEEEKKANNNEGFIRYSIIPTTDNAGRTNSIIVGNTAN